MARTLVVAHDFSPGADAAARAAVDELCADHGGKLVLIHAYSAIPPLGFAEDVPADAYAVLERSIAEDAGSRLDHVAVALRSLAQQRGCAIEVATEVRIGPPADEVIRCAVDRHADLIVTGSHGRRGLAHAFLGSVAERIVRMSPLSVLVVKARPQPA